jgi:hypothetical protein
MLARNSIRISDGSSNAAVPDIASGEQIPKGVYLPHDILTYW